MTYLYFIFEIIALVFCLATFSKFKDKHYRLFLPFLMLIVLYELGSFNNWFMINKTNLWIANIIINLEFTFYTYFLSLKINDQQWKKWMRMIILLNLIIYIINISFFSGFFKLHTYSFVIQSFAIVVFVFKLLFQLSQGEDQIRILRLPEFWLCTGLLFFYLSEVLFFSGFSYMAYQKDYKFTNLFWTITNFANVILYSALSVAFLCLARKKEYLQ